MAICAERTPPAFTAGAGHVSACWLLDTGAESHGAPSQEAATETPAAQGRRSASPGANGDTPDLGKET